MKRKPKQSSHYLQKKTKICLLEDGSNSSTADQSSTSTHFPSNHQLFRAHISTLHQKSMKELLVQLKQKEMISSEVISMLTLYFGSFPVELLKHTKHNTDVKKCGMHHDDSVKQFVITLYFYSPKAYEYLKTLFTLPHPKVILEYLMSCNGEPGFLTEVFDYITVQLPTKPWLKDCALITDYVCVKSQVQWDPSLHKYMGYADTLGLADEKDRLATKALVFMIVSLRNGIKCPVAYFFVHKISSNVQAQLVNMCLVKLHEVGVKVWSITCDASPANVSMLAHLGCNFVEGSMTSHFAHSLMGEVRVILDLYHLLNLAKGCLSRKHMLQSDIGHIKWDYIKKLYTLQTHNLKFANVLLKDQLSCKTLNNVKPMFQALHSSVADAIDSLRKSGNPSFNNSEPTVQFIRYMARVVDMLTSSNPFSTGYKQVLCLENKNYWTRAFSDTKEYLQSLKLDDIPLLMHPRKTFALGCIVSLKSIGEIADKLLNRSDEYLPTYKFSHDHLELYFSHIIPKEDWHNTSTRQFQLALTKKLFVNNASEGGNYFNPEYPTVETVCEFRSEKRRLTEPSSASGITVEADLANLKFIELLDSKCLKEYQGKIIHRITNNIVLKLLTKLTCTFCHAVLLHGDSTIHPVEYTQSIGRRVRLSSGAFRIVKCSEQISQIHISHWGMANVKDIDVIITQTVIRTMLMKSIHPFVMSHPVVEEFGCEDLHEIQLMKIIIKEYVNLRLKTCTEKCSLSMVDEG